MVMDNTGLTVIRQGMGVVGVRVRTEQFKRNFLQEVVNGEPAKLVRALVPMEDAQEGFQVLRLSATSRLSHLIRTVPPPSHAKLLQFTTLWWSGRWRLS